MIGEQITRSGSLWSSVAAGNRRMQALVYMGTHRLEVQEVPVPIPGPNELLIRVHYAGICGSDLHGFEGRSTNRRPPLVMGHEFSGTVLATGDDVEGFAEGEYVTVNPLLSCGRCIPCRAGRANVCTRRRLIGIDYPGGFAELVIAPVDNVFALPLGMPLRLGALAEPLANAVHVASLGPRNKFGACFIVGAGAIGLLCLQIARLVGAAPVLIADRNPHRLHVARDLGADVTIDVTQEDPVERVRAETRSGAAWTVDAVGTPPTRQQAVSALANGGTAVFIGLEKGSGEIDLREAILRELSLHGSYAYTPDEFATAIELLARGRINPAGWLSSASLADGQALFAELTTPTTPRVKAMFDLV
jgi:2-desacetyl-2-hydroxyethyl bacteriochlorophyllide A dehydrogenase